MIGLVDYGLGNISAFANIYRRLGIDAMSARSPEDILHASKLILPGVGAFDWAMARLTESGLRGALDEAVLGRGIPVLGVCVGMQMMARSSEEGVSSGLGWIGAEVQRFRRNMLPKGTRLPHMGWNDVSPRQESPLFGGIESPCFYFLHSYYFSPDEPEDVIASAVYGAEFAAAVCAGRIYGAQFHPEKSHDWGITLLRNFAENC